MYFLFAYCLCASQIDACRGTQLLVQQLQADVAELRTMKSVGSGAALTADALRGIFATNEDLKALAEELQVRNSFLCVWRRPATLPQNYTFYRFGTTRDR